MQANTANEHSQMLAQIPANACSDLESRTGMCSLVLLLVSYSTLASQLHEFLLLNTARLRVIYEQRPTQDHHTYS